MVIDYAELFFLLGGLVVGFVGGALVMHLHKLIKVASKNA